MEDIAITTAAERHVAACRLLRSSERLMVGRGRIWHGMGQMQPVIMGYERGRITLRIEDVEGGRPCWRILPLPRHRADAKRLFGALERHHLDGTRTPASEAWDRIREPRNAA